MKHVSVSLQKASGFTLVEVLIGLGIMSMIILGIVGIMNMVYGTNEQAVNQAITMQDARKCMNELTDAIRFAKSIVKVETNSIKLTGSDDKTYTITFDSTDKKVYRTPDGEAKAAMTRGHIQSLSFTLDPTDDKKSTIQIEMTVSSHVGNGRSPMKVQTVVSMLNR